MRGWHGLAFRLALALLSAAVLADLLGVGSDTAALWIAGTYLEVTGIAVGTLALAARVLSPGRATLRRVSTGRAVLAVVARIAALLLLALVVWVRGDAAIPPDPAVLLVESLALTLLLGAGWVDRRPADGPAAP